VPSREILPRYSARIDRRDASTDVMTREVQLSPAFQREIDYRDIRRKLHLPVESFYAQHRSREKKIKNVYIFVNIRGINGIINKFGILTKVLIR